jgi:pyridoxamine 5'-phosphate oxidase
MLMNKQEIIEFINKNPACNLATCEQQQPRVRGMLTYKADEKGILFTTGSTKDLYQQIVANPNVELCYFNKETNTQIRVTGKAKVLEDLDLKKQIVKDFSFLQPVVDQFGYEALAVFRVVAAEALVWTFATNIQPKQPIKMS